MDFLQWQNLDSVDMYVLDHCPDERSNHDPFLKIYLYDKSMIITRFPELLEEKQSQPTLYSFLYNHHSFLH